MRTILFSLVASLGMAGGAVADPVQPRNVIELFTSQGCSSCPPADRFANDLAHDQSTLVLTFAVDYWDYLGWKDTLATSANTARQRGYAMARGDRKVYTPQMIVNGREAAVGGDSAAVMGAVQRAGTDGGLALPVTIETIEGRIDVTIAAPSKPLDKTHGEVWAFAVEKQRDVQIARGENAGRSATYANVVRHMTRLGAWDGAPAHFDIAAEEVMKPDTDSVAIVVQSGNGGLPGQIFGAAIADVSGLTPPPPTTTSRLMRNPN